MDESRQSDTGVKSDQVGVSSSSVSHFRSAESEVTFELAVRNTSYSIAKLRTEMDTTGLHLISFGSVHHHHLVLTQDETSRAKSRTEKNTIGQILLPKQSELTATFIISELGF